MPAVLSLGNNEFFKGIHYNLWGNIGFNHSKIKIVYFWHFF